LFIRFSNLSGHFGIKKSKIKNKSLPRLALILLVFFLIGYVYFSFYNDFLKTRENALVDATDNQISESAREIDIYK